LVALIVGLTIVSPIKASNATKLREQNLYQRWQQRIFFNKIFRLIADKSDNTPKKIPTIVPPISDDRIHRGNPHPLHWTKRTKYHGYDNFELFPGAQVRDENNVWQDAYGIERHSLTHETLWALLASKKMPRSLRYYGWHLAQDASRPIQYYRRASGNLLKVGPMSLEICKDSSIDRHTLIFYSDLDKGKIIDDATRTGLLTAFDEIEDFHTFISTTASLVLGKPTLLHMEDIQFIENPVTLIDPTNWNLIDAEKWLNSSPSMQIVSSARRFLRSIPAPIRP